MNRSKSASAPEPIAPPGWPEKMIELGKAWKQEANTAKKEAIFSDLWVLTLAAVSKYLRIHGGRSSRISTEDLQDLASQKALDLLRSLVGGKWDPTDTSPAQLCSFVSTLARNGVVDLLRTHGGRQWADLEAVQGGRELHRKVRGRWQQESSETLAQRQEFAIALRDCASQLKNRTRRIWFLRTFYEMSTREIAAHKDIQMRAGAVDMTLKRCREKISTCMKRKDFDGQDLLPGTFTTLFEVFRNEARPS